MLLKEFVDFSKEFEKRIVEEVEEGYHVKFHDVTKNNGVVYHGITIMSEHNLAPTFYEESFFDYYKNDNNMDDTVAHFFTLFRHEYPGKNLELDFFTDFEIAKNNICYKLINKNKNEELLKKIPHIAFLNLAICFYYSMDEISEMKGSILIYNEHVDMWKTSTQEIYQYASINTPKKMPMERMAIQDLLEGVPMCEMEKLSPPEDFMYVFSNSNRTYGAISLFYPGVLEDTAEYLKGNFYIIPSSVHELLIVRDLGTQDENYLKEMVKCVNLTSVTDEDYLSNHPYYYDRAVKKIRQI